MARGDFPSSKQDQYMLRFPDGMRDRLKDEAARNNRSLNAEIIARLETTLEEFGPYTSEGMMAIVKRLEASLDMAHDFAVGLLYELRAAGGAASDDDRDVAEAIAAYARDHDMNKPSAAHFILADWLRERGYLPPKPEGKARALQLDENSPGGNLPSFILRKPDPEEGS